MFVGNLVCGFFLGALVSCGYGFQNSESKLTSHSTQSWSVTKNSQPLSMVAQSGACLTTPPRTTFASDYCFNAVPAARVSVDVSAPVGSLIAFCVATHLPGMAAEAALLVVDSQGQLVSEVTGSGGFQLIDTFPRSGSYTLYVGFPKIAGAQQVVLRVAPLSAFTLTSPACSLK